MGRDQKNRRSAGALPKAIRRVKEVMAGIVVRGDGAEARRNGELTRRLSFTCASF